MHSQAFRDCLLDLDVPRARRLWRETRGHLPQPKSDHEMLMVLHHARTQAESVPLNLRAYSHAWLMERSLPSGLPDHLKPSAQRLYPIEVKAVGVMVGTVSESGQARAKAIEKVMSDAVAECYADGVTDPEIVKARMLEAREKFARSN